MVAQVNGQRVQVLFDVRVRSMRGWNKVLENAADTCVQELYKELRKVDADQAEFFMEKAQKIRRSDTPLALWEHFRATARKECGKMRRTLFCYARIWHNHFETSRLEQVVNIVRDHLFRAKE